VSVSHGRLAPVCGSLGPFFEGVCFFRRRRLLLWGGCACGRRDDGGVRHGLSTALGRFARQEK